jgi:[ribosomal protein S5]-alanine N-acetyltransferase
MPLPAPSAIETRRTLLRLVEPPDLPALMQVNGDDEVTRFLPYATWGSLADAQAWYERVMALHASGSALQFVLIEKETAQAVGTCLLFRHDEKSRRAELGYVLGRRRWGRGLMNEALHALIGHAFQALDIRRLEAEVHPENLASARLLERIGFAREGLLRQRWVAAGRPYDVIAFGLLRHEYRPPSGDANGVCL